MALIKHLKSVPNEHSSDQAPPYEMDAFSDTEADGFAPMDDPELFMNARERRLLAMHRAVKARDAKIS
jgi:hypothetical protein